MDDVHAPGGQTLGGFLEQLAARVPAPGGGASAAIQAAQGAALLGMVARYSTDESYAPHVATIDRVRSEADRLRVRALELAAEDAAAYAAVSEAYRLPSEPEEASIVRSTALAQALTGAAQPPADTIALACHLVALAEELLPVGNRNVLTDVAAAAEAARAALATARLNVEVNLRGIKGESARAALMSVLAGVDAHITRAGQVTEAVRKEIVA